tara:strand:+ start:317 stop:616 length:300 start_codon:yes stop_codon:yes gene_type:complete
MSYKRDKNEEKLDDVVKRLIKSYGYSSKFNEYEVVEAFNKIMGPVIMKKVSNAYVFDKKLVLKLTSAPLRQELSMEKSKLISMINDELGSDFLKDILIQ